MKILSILGHILIGLTIGAGALVSSFLASGHLMQAADETKDLFTRK